MLNKKAILGTFIDAVTMEQAVKIIDSFYYTDRCHTVYTPNSEILMQAFRDKNLQKILNEGDLVVPDGAGVILASKILSLNFPQKVSGVDLVKALCKNPGKKPLRIFILGGKPGVAEMAGQNLEKCYPDITITGYINGYFKPEDEDYIISCINNSSSDILLAGLGAPKQEKWIHNNKTQLKVSAALGIGGSLDIYAGISKLAPEFIRRMGFEWLYRLIKEPWRYKRMTDLPRFILTVIKPRNSGDSESRGH